METSIIENRENRTFSINEIDCSLFNAILFGLWNYIDEYGKISNYKDSVKKAQELADKLLSYEVGEEVTTKKPY